MENQVVDGRIRVERIFKWEAEEANHAKAVLLLMI
jgi:hypothetical protein